MPIFMTATAAAPQKSAVNSIGTAPVEKSLPKPTPPALPPPSTFSLAANASPCFQQVPILFYYVEDLLGTSRVTTTNTGAVCYDADYYPYGGERSYTNTCPQNNYKFEGKERDTETGNDDFGARYYSNRFGRGTAPTGPLFQCPSPTPTSPILKL